MNGRMQWVILALLLLNTALSAAAAAYLKKERREDKQKGPDETGEDAVTAENAEALGARLAERRFSEGVMNVLSYENPAGKGNGA